MNNYANRVPRDIPPVKAKMYEQLHNSFPADFHFLCKMPFCRRGGAKKAERTSQGSPLRMGRGRVMPRAAGP